MRAFGPAILLALTAVFAVPTQGVAQVAIPAMLGAWQGDAQIVVSWTTQRSLAVRIEIHADDRVTGTIGDAALVGGRLLRNDGEGARTMRWKADYLIDANLAGRVIRAENVWRTSVQLALTWQEGQFDGGLSTSGWRVAGSDRRVIDASVVLRRAPIRVVCEHSPQFFEP